MDEHLSEICIDSSSSTHTRSDFEEMCLKQLDNALHKFFLNTKNCDSLSIYPELKEVFLKSCENHLHERCLDSNSGNNDMFKVNRAVQYLQDLGGVLFVVNVATKTCVTAKNFSKFPKCEIIGKHINHFVHEEDRHHFILPKQSGAGAAVSEQFDCFLCRFNVNCNETAVIDKQENCEPPVYDMTMKCVKFIERINAEKFPDSCAKGENLLFCVASQAAPPNQTVKTKGKIPQPEKFCTLQNSEGKVISVGLNCVDVRLLNRTSIPSYLDDVIRRSMNSFFTTNHKFLLRQVLSRGKGSCRSRKFSLSDGTLATLMTKSELVSHNTRKDQQILSTHYVYREGTLKGLDVQGLPKSLHNTIPVPPVTQTAASNEAIVTMTTSSIATTTSFSSDDFLASNHYAGQSSKKETYPSEGAPPYQSWPRSARPSLEVTNNFFSGMTGTDQSFQNEVVSPPPHLDGHLVHSVGGHNTPSSLNQLLTSGSNNFQMPSSQPLSTPSISSIPTEGGGFLSPDPDVDLLNPGAFPGPPCVDLSSCEFPTKSDISLPATTSSMNPVFINGITTMRMEASVTTTQCRVSSVNTTSISPSVSKPQQATPFSPNHRACVTPDKTPNQCQQSPPKRPRSASINTTASSNGALKRSSSTLSEDSGIGELSHGKKLSPHRLKIKEKAKTSAKKHKILSELLTAKNPDGIPIAFTAASNNSASTSTSSSQQIISSIADRNQPHVVVTSQVSGHVVSSATSHNSVSQPMMMSNQVSTTSSVSEEKPTPMNAVPQVGTVASFPSPPNPFHPTSETQVDNPNEIDELFDCIESLMSNPATSAPPQPQLHQQQPQPLQQPLQQQQQPQVFISGSTQPYNDSININSLQTATQNAPFPSRMTQNSTMGSLNRNPSDILLSPVNNQGFMRSPQPPPPNRVIPSPQGIHRAPLNSNPTYRRIVPTGQETCPNRVVGSGVMVSQKPPQRIPSLNQYGDLAPQESWAGQEPLVDLGAIPPPSGINPRMTIPSQNHLDPPGMMAGANTLQSQNPINHTLCQAPLSTRMQFQSPIKAMPSSMQMHMAGSPRHKMANNNTLAQSVSPNAFPNSVSPTGYSNMRASLPLNNNPRPSYNNLQQQRFPPNGNIRSRLLRQQIRPNPPPPYQSDIPQLGGAQQYTFNAKQEISPYLVPQRQNGVMMQQRKASPIMQRGMPSSTPQNTYNQMNSNRFPNNKQAMGRFSPVTPQPNHLPNPSYNSQLSPSLNFDSVMRQRSIVAQHNPTQFNTGPTDMFSSMGPRMSGSYPEQMSNSPSVVSMGKPQLKRSRSKKAVRKKTDSMDDLSRGDDMNMYKNPMMQMTMGNLYQQRSHNTFTSPLDGVPSNTPMMSPEGGGMQTLNLNSMVNQPNPKMMEKVAIDNGVSPFHTLPNPSPLQPNLSVASNWSSPYKDDVGMTSSLTDDSMFNMFDGGASLRSNAYSFDGLPAADSNITLNSNINNNNFDVNSHLRFTSTTSMLSSASRDDINSIERPARRLKNTRILESLLLKKDD